ncbi:HEAT repeat domain-containing protein [Engelhardtia mirabilis]|uniref:von Willebrand factor type A domain protein n=1 Tax=Engelhardtia mirabilis TaxID=2528011 RepID=A0A518BS34_9BACT|nr:von Willebrand factor type A domain protein [Planctomycetes bacterium Pla133]QDV04104.1 von Willebrand factor type A domain protein [Planctomycetes bacterium Pla86]
MQLRLLLLLSPLALCQPVFAEPAAGLAVGQDEVDVSGFSTEQLIERLESLRDEAGYDTIRALGKSREPAAAQALVKSLRVLGSLGARLEVLKALSRFGGIAGAEQAAMQKLLDVATVEQEIEVRDQALQSLANAAGLGREYLAMVVEFPVDDAVRKRAMELHVEQKQRSDEAFYRRMLETEPKTDGKPRGKDKEEEQEVRRLPEVRELAFIALAEWLSVEELVPSVEDWSRTVRRTAVQELHRRGAEEAFSAAEGMFKRRDEWPENRLAAARVLLEIARDDWIGEVVDEGGRRDASMEEVQGCADLVVEFGDEKIFKDIAKRLGKGGTPEKLFAIRSLVGYSDKKVSKALIKLLEDKSMTVRLAVIKTMADRGDPSFLETLDEVLADALEAAADEKADDYSEPEFAQLIDSISRLRTGDEAWNAKLIEFAGSDLQGLRNAAVRVLGSRSPEKSMAQLEAALVHEDWSTRLIALEALEKLRTKAVVGLMIAQIQNETGRMADAFGDTLWRLTGQPFAKNGRSWAAWWKDHEGDFEPIDPKSLRALEEERERRRLEESSKAPDFFGLRIESTRVTFVVDVSGSMEEPTLTRYAGEKGPKRMDVAKKQLDLAIERLDPAALFNILTFSFDVNGWKDALTRGSVEAKAEASEYISSLRAGGGTNLYSALQAAFDDPEMDTLVVLSDGEPSVGDITEPGMIREQVATWNQERHVIIHTVQVGGQFKILEWLAKDSGGETVAIP